MLASFWRLGPSFRLLNKHVPLTLTDRFLHHNPFRVTAWLQNWVNKQHHTVAAVPVKSETCWACSERGHYIAIRWTRKRPKHKTVSQVSDSISEDDHTTHLTVSAKMTIQFIFSGPSTRTWTTTWPRPPASVGIQQRLSSTRALPSQPLAAVNHDSDSNHQRKSCVTQGVHPVLIRYTQGEHELSRQANSRNRLRPQWQAMITPQQANMCGSRYCRAHWCTGQDIHMWL